MLGIRNSTCEGKQQYTDKNLLIAEFDRLAEKFGDRLDQTPIHVRSCLSTSHGFRLHSDDRVSLDDFMKYPDTILVGKVFLCRTITPCMKIMSLLTVVEVPDAHLKDNAVFLSLNNYQHPLDEKQERSIPIFPTGTILAVGNPILFKPKVDGMYTVRCDNPSDVFVLSQKEFEYSFPDLVWPSGKSNKEIFPLDSNASEIRDWKAIGHSWLERKNYVAALQCYTAAVDHDHEEIEALNLRCSMHLHLNLHQKALKDATEILDKNPLLEEAVSHKARSLIGLSQYKEAIEFLSYHIKQGMSFSDDVENIRLKKLIVEAETRSNQERYGDYDFIKMLRCGIGHYHDCADYVGNVVEQEVAGKGRGMIATEDIKSGDLIVAEKATAMAIAVDAEEQDWLIDTQATQNPSRAIVHLQTCIAQRMILDPEIAKSIYNLYDGTEKSDKSCDHSENEYINMRKIIAIYNLNAFSQSSHCIYNDGKEHVKVMGLWPAASLFNHGCFDSNSIWKICGNVIFVRACRDIKKGEEITLLYVSYMNQSLDRAFGLSNYSIVCTCALCTLDSEETTAIHDRRKKILQELKTLFSNKDARCSELMILIEELQQQRVNKPELNIYTIWPMITLANRYISEKKHSNAIEILQNVLKMTCKTVLTKLCARCCMDGLLCSLMGRDIENAKLFAASLKEGLIQEYGIYSEDVVKFVVPDGGEALAVLRLAPLSK